MKTYNSMPQDETQLLQNFEAIQAMLVPADECVDNAIYKTRVFTYITH